MIARKQDGDETFVQLWNGSEAGMLQYSHFMYAGEAQLLVLFELLVNCKAQEVIL